MEAAFVFTAIAILILVFAHMKYQPSDSPPTTILRDDYFDYPKDHGTSAILKAAREEIRSKFENWGDYDVAGVHIGGRKRYIIEECAIDDEVELKHEKSNKHSSRAIKIMHYGKKIGYIPEVDLDDVHPVLQMPHEAFISEIDYDDDYLSVTVSIVY